MNLYFWFFVLYSVLITPVSAQIQLRFEKGMHYRLRLRAAGMPVLKIQKNKQSEKEAGPVNFLSRLQGGEGSVVLQLLKNSSFFQKIQWQDLHIYMHFSCRDAAQNALLYMAARTVLTVFDRACSFPLRWQMDMDFQGQGSIFAIHCIAKARMGRLIASVVRLGLAEASSRRKQRKAEEEQHAASH